MLEVAYETQDHRGKELLLWFGQADAMVKKFRAKAYAKGSLSYGL